MAEILRTGATPESTPTDLRRPCATCESTDGVVIDRNGQRVVRCERCDAYQYNQPRHEAGLAPEPTRSSGVKPKVRQRILAAHGHACASCGRSSILHGVTLHLDHMIPVAAAREYGVYDELIESEWNLVPMCAECNTGKGGLDDSVPIVLMYRALMMKAKVAVRDAT